MIPNWQARNANAKSCSICHPDGEGIKNKSQNLVPLINSCISGALKGKKLPTDSKEMHALQLYISSLKTK